MQIDIGFGDIVYPEPEESDFPTMLNYPEPRLLCYSRESSIAEKFETMVKLGVLNSRMKDFYDIWLLSRQFDFDGARLSEAIRLTFGQRDTELPAKVEIFTESFIDEKQVQWAAFLRRLQQDHVPTSFREIMASVDSFLSPVIAAFPPGNHIPQTGLHQAHGSDPAKVKGAMGEYLQLVDRFYENNKYDLAPQQYEAAKNRL